MMENEIDTNTEQPRTRRDVVRLGAALLGTGLGLASLTGAAARERERESARRRSWKWRRWPRRPAP
jgi:hypothetical protein